jgi:hypothetical protein
MKIIASRSFSNGGTMVKTGDVIEVSEQLAKGLVEKRLAKYYGNEWKPDSRAVKVDSPPQVKDVELVDISNPFKEKARATRKSKAK